MKLTARITDDWLPIPEPLLKQLQWTHGDRVLVEVIDDVMLVTKEKQSDEAPTRRPGAVRGAPRRT